MNYLVDENISKSEKFLSQNLDFRNVKKFIGEGADDNEIIKRALEGDFIVLTQDTRLALHALVGGVKVWYFNVKTGTDHKLAAAPF